MADDAKEGPEPEQDLERLRRENRMLREGMQQSERMQRLWQQALEELGRAREQLQSKNRRLESLYRAATALAHTADQVVLFSHIMEVMEQLLALPEPHPMGVFLVEEDGSMELVAQRLGGERFAQAHKGMRVGDCLCGRAAQGELIISDSCADDPRRTIPYVHDQPHGHLIIPLKAKERVVGVFYYYLPAGHKVGQELLDTFIAIGCQLGLAIDNARLYAEVIKLTNHDALTGLGNRRYLHELLGRDLYNAARYQGTLSLLMLDIDHFKHYNDTHGHPAGDRLLIKVAHILRTVVRSGDLPVRYGGEEFVVLLPQTDGAAACLAAERLRSAVAQQCPVTISVGVASVTGQRCTAEALIATADRALYLAKENGRNRVELSHEVLA
jgi:diguanylate cyclase (GGDEF)-like protein